MKNFKRWFFVSLALLLAAAFAAPQLSAQTQTTGDVTGVVTDPSNAVVPDAKVTLKDSGRGGSQDTKTNKEGAYRFYLLPPGSYTIVVAAAGFQTTQAKVDVELGQVATGNVQLAVGASSQTVVVTETAPLLSSDDGNVASTLNEQQVQQLPNSGNDITFNAQLAPGSVMNTAGGGLGNFSSFGVSATSNLFTLNGMDDNDPFLSLNNSGATNLTLGNNEIQEVSVVTNGYSGQYGTLAGASVNFVTKGGSNEFHGKADYYWNGRDFNANNWFRNDSGEGRPFVNANQWGADIGGPIVKNKAFWYFNTEGLYLIIPAGASQTLIPSPQFAAATQNFINNKFGAGSATSAFYQQIFSLYAGGPRGNPTTAVSGGGCDSSVSAINSALGSTVFGPTAEPCAIEYVSSATNRTHDWLVAGRVDWNIGNNDRMYTRIQKEHGLQASITDPINAIFNAQSDQPEYQGQYQWTHVFSGSTVNQFVAAGQWYAAQFNNVSRAATLAVFPTLLNVPGDFTSLGGPNGLGDNLPQGRNVTQVQLSDDFSKTIGAHTLKIGLKFRRNDVTDFDLGAFANGLLQPANQDAFFFGGFDPNQVGTGTLNSITTLQQSFTKSTEFPAALYNLGGYVEDDWKVNNNLTLTLAARLEHNSNPICTTLCFAAPITQFSSLNHDVTVPYDQTIVTGEKQALHYLTTVAPEPRFGFAYTPHIFGMKGDTVIRGGIGIFYDAFPGIVVDNFAQNSPAFNVFVAGSPTAPGNLAPGAPNSLFSLASASNAGFLSGFSSGETLAQIQAQVAGFTPPGLTSASRKNFNPQYQKWSLEVQHSFGKSMSLDVEYVGNHGIHEFYENNGENAFGYATFPAAPADARFGPVTQLLSNGVSNYNGLVAAFTKRWGTGQLQFNYVYSHALDDVSNGGNPGVPFVSAAFGATNSTIQFPENPFNVKQFNYGNADYDTKHYVSANYVWTLPIRRALFGHGWKPLVDGWQVSGTVFGRSGLPFTLVDNAISAGLGGNNFLATIFGDQLTSSGAYVNCARTFGSTNPSIGSCLNPAAFSAPAAGSFGNVTRNQLRGTPYFDSDFSVMKETSIPRFERGRLGIGFQMFNVFNHPNFQAPIGDVSSSLFGQVVATVSAPTSIYGSGLGGDASPRLIQLKAQFTF